MYGVLSLNKPFSVSCAALIPRFIESSDVYAIAHGSLIQFSIFKKGHFNILYEYTIFGNVIKIFPLCSASDSQSNVLLILSNQNFCVLRYVRDSITTVQSGNIRSSTGSPLDPPYRFAISEHAFLAQLNQQVIQYFPITSNSQLSAPFNCLISSKYILDFDFLNYSDNVSKIVILTEEFNGNTRVALYEGSEEKETLTVRQNSICDLPSDAYKMQVINGERNIVSVFTTNAALRICFKAASPVQNGSTIYTPEPLVIIKRISNSTHLAVDSGRNLLFLDLAEQNRITVSRIGSIDIPVSIFSLSDNKAITLSHSGSSSLITLKGISEEKPTSEIELLHTVPGPIHKIIPLHNHESSSSEDILGLCSNGFGHVVCNSYEFIELESLTAENVIGVWFIDKYFICTLPNSTEAFKQSSTGSWVHSSIDWLITKETTFCLSNSSQITPSAAIFNGTNYNPSKNSQFICGDINIDSAIAVDSNLKAHIFLPKSNTTITLQRSPQASSTNGEYSAFSFWDSSEVVLYHHNKLIARIPDTPSVALKFISSGLLIIEVRDRFSFIPNSHLKSLNNPNDTFDKTPFSHRAEGVHSTITSTPPYIITGEQPIIINETDLGDIEIHGFEAPHCIAAASSDLLALTDGSQILLGHLSEPKAVIHQDRCALEVIDSVELGVSKYAVCTFNGKDYCIHIAGYPLDASAPRDSLSLSAYTAMAALPRTKPLEFSKGKHEIEEEEETKEVKFILDQTDELSAQRERIKEAGYLAIATGNHIQIYEVWEFSLQRRTELTLKKAPFALVEFLGRLLVAFEDEMALYELEVVSQSVVLMKKTSEFQTQGASCTVSVRGKQIAVGDILQSVVLYEFVESSLRFEEVARSTVNFGISKVLLFDEGVFAVDQRDTLLFLTPHNTRNIWSEDLGVKGSCRLVESATALGIRNGTLIVGTEDTQYLAVKKIDWNQNIDALYRTIEENVESLGRFSPKIARIALIGNYQLHGYTMPNLDLFKSFVELGEEIQAEICSKAGVDLENALKICHDIVSLD